MMRFFSLVKINLKTASDDLTQNLNLRKSDTKLKSLGKKALVGVLVVYLLGIIAIPSNYIIDIFSKVNQTNLLIHLLFLIAPVVTLYFSILSTPGVFYFSKDIQNYLTMPLRSWEIIGAKFVTAYIQTVLGLGFILAPGLVLFIVKVKPSLLYMLYTVISLFIIPIIPLALAVLVIILLMRFVPFFKNKDLFMYLSFGLVFIPIFVISLSSGALSDSPEKVDAIMQSLMNMDNAAYEYFNFFFPTSKLLSNGVINQTLLPILFTLILSLILLVIVLFVSEGLYFEGVLGITEQNSKKKRLNLSKRDSMLKQESHVLNFLKVDFKNILRTPTFVINYLSPFVIMPLIAFVPLLLNGVPKNLNSITQEASSLFHDLLYSVPLVDQIQITLSAGFAIGFLMANFDSSSNTAISREGKQIQRYLNMPVSFTDFIKAKTLLSIFFSFIVPFTLVLFGSILLRPKFLTILVFLLGSILGILIVVLTSILIDTYSPSLTWDTEQQAIKGNFKQVLVVLPFMFAPMLLILLATSVESYITLIILLIGGPALICFLYRKLIKVTNTNLINTIQNLEA